MDFSNIFIIDGALGTILQSKTKGASTKYPPEYYTISDPELIISIHTDYINAGAEIITANTFGANELKLKASACFDGITVEDIVKTAVGLAQTAIERSGRKGRLIALDVGSTGVLLAPFGTLAFEDAVAVFKRMIRAGVGAGVDIILIETMIDIYEAKAAVLAAKEVIAEASESIPILCTFTFGTNDRLVTGAEPETVANVFGCMGVDALGANCSFNESVIDRMSSPQRLPIIVQPNAGLPVMKDGSDSFPGTPAEHLSLIERFVGRGATLIGGCCGTTPEHIKRLAEEYGTGAANTQVIGAQAMTKAVKISSYSKTIDLNADATIYATLDLTPAKSESDVVNETLDLLEDECDVICVKAGNIPLCECVPIIQELTSTPLCFTSADDGELAAALRIYNGVAAVQAPRSAALDNALCAYGGHYAE